MTETLERLPATPDHDTSVPPAELSAKRVSATVSEEIDTYLEDYMKNYDIQDARRRLDDVYESSNQAAKDIIERKRDTKPLGSGVEKVVYAYGEDKVLAFFKSSDNPERAEKMKQLFFERKLIHLLLPDNFPDVHLAGSQPGVMVSERVIPSTEKKTPLSMLKHKSSQLKLKYKLRKMDIGVDDGSSKNFIKDKNGNEVYVDNPFFYPSRKIIKAVNNLDDGQRAKAIRYMWRAFPDYSNKYFEIDDSGRVRNHVDHYGLQK